jgi:uncharacterized membrane protein
MDNSEKILKELSTIKEHLMNQEQRLADLERKSVAESSLEPGEPISPPQKDSIFKPSFKKEKPPASPKPQISWEARIGENYLQKIGVVAVLLGVSFFLKYSFDQGWIGPSGQIAIGILIGIAFLGAGEFFVKKYEKWAHVMSGGGIAVLYFSLFATRNIYELLSVEIAFLFMILVTVMAVIAAIRYNSLPLALFGIIGGFVTPLLVASPDPNIWVLILYAYMLSIGVLGISHFKQWGALQLPAFVFTAGYFLYATMELNEFRPLMTLLAIFFVIYSVMPFYHHLIQKKTTKKVNFVLTILNAVFVAGATFFIVGDFHENYLGIAFFILAVAYFVESYLAFTRAPQNKGLMLALMAIFIALLTAIIPIELENHEHIMTAAFAAEALLLFWAGFRLKLTDLRTYAAIIQGIALVSWFICIDSFLVNSTVLINSFVGLTIFVIALMGAISYLYQKNKNHLGKSEKDIPGILMVLMNLMGVFILSHQASHYFDLMKTNNAAFSNRDANQATQVSLSVIWVLYAISLLVVGIAKQIKSIRFLGLALFGVTIFKVFFVDLGELPTEYRIIAFIVLGIFLIGASFLYQRYKHLIHEKVL